MVVPKVSARRGVVSLLAGAGMWELLARYLWTDSLFFPPLSEIFDRGAELFRDGTLWPHITTSLQEYALGLAMAAVVGLTIGVLMASSRRVLDTLDPWVSILNATPIVALAPLFILAFGLGQASKVAVVFLITVVPIILNTKTGMATTDPRLVETARSFGASTAQIYRYVRFPSAVPYVITGFRLAGAYGFIGVVVGELFGARSGIGLFIRRSAEVFDTAGLFVGVMLLGFGGVVVTYSLLWLEHRIAPWRAAQGEGE